MDPRLRFLMALRNLYNKGAVKTINEAMDFAKREFGEINDLFKRQIEQVFKRPVDKTPKPGEGGITSIKNAPKKETPPQESGTIMDRISKASNRIEELMKEQEAMYKPKQGLQLAEGLTRTIARKILDRKNIEIPKGKDPIGVFSDVFGESISDVNNLAEELIEIDQRGGGLKNIDKMIEMEGLFDIKIPKNPQRGLTDEEMLKLKKEVDQEKQLKDFDPTDREPNAMGGFNRTNFNIGSLPKGIQALVKGINKKFGKGTMKTADEIDQPEKTTQQLISEFEAREKANKEMDAIVKDQIEGGFIRDMEKSMQKDMQRELKKPEREILDVPEVPEGFKLSKEKLMAKFPELDEAFADEMMNMDKDIVGRLIKMLENRRLDPEAYDRLLAEFGDTLQFQKEFDKYIRRKKNAEGGLQYLMGM